MVPFRLALIGVCAGLWMASAAACAPARDTRGYVLSEKAIDAISPGKDTRDTVLIALGTPSAIGTFERNSWYYVSAQTETVAYRAPKVLDQEVVAIDFTDRGVVSTVKRYNLADAERINPVERVTPTRGRELNLFEQLIGNLGKFNNQPAKAPSARQPR